MNIEESIYHWQTAWKRRQTRYGLPCSEEDWEKYLDSLSNYQLITELRDNGVAY